jgi:hypothetical protein
MAARSSISTKRAWIPRRGQRDLEQVVCAAVQARGGDEVIAGAEQGQQRERLGRLAGGHAQRGHAALERGQPLLEGVRGGVHDARVDVAELLEREERGGVVGVAELVAGGLIDGHRARAGGGIGLIARVQGQGLGAVLGGGRHGFLAIDASGVGLGEGR